MKRTIILSLAAMAIVVSACSTTAATPAPATPAPATEAPSMAPELSDIVDTATAAGSFETLLAAATAAGLVETLKSEGPFTVFAPTDEAFAALPEGTVEGLLADPEALKQILLYHVVSGKVTADQVVSLTSADSVAGPAIKISVVDGKVMLNDSATVVTPDVMTSNGVIHVIDQVILPPAEAMATEAPSMAPELSDIVDTATAAGSFETLLAAATAAGLVETLKSEGPFTVFAPTDEAFAALPEGTVEGLLADPEALKQILLYHVVSGKVTADQVVSLTSADSVAGPAIKISVVDGKVMLNDSATVVTPDVMTSNGVIHVIDQVILPPAS